MSRPKKPKSIKTTTTTTTTETPVKKPKSTKTSSTTTTTETPVKKPKSIKTTSTTPSNTMETPVKKPKSTKTTTLRQLLDEVEGLLGEGHDGDIRRMASELRTYAEQAAQALRESNARRVILGREIDREAKVALSDPEATVADVRARWADLLGVSDGEVKRLLSVSRKVTRLLGTSDHRVVTLPASLLEVHWKYLPKALREALGEDTTTGKDTPEPTWAEKAKARAARVAQTIEKEAKTPAEVRVAVAALRAEAIRLNKLAKAMEQAEEEAKAEAEEAKAEEPEVEVKEAQEPEEEQETPQGAEMTPIEAVDALLDEVNSPPSGSTRPIAPELNFAAKWHGHSMVNRMVLPALTTSWQSPRAVHKALGGAVTLDDVAKTFSLMAEARELGDTLTEADKRGRVRLTSEEAAQRIKEMMGEEQAAK